MDGSFKILPKYLMRSVRNRNFYQDYGYMACDSLITPPLITSVFCSQKPIFAAE